MIQHANSRYLSPHSFYSSGYEKLILINAILDDQLLYSHAMQTRLPFNLQRRNYLTLIAIGPLELEGLKTMKTGTFFSSIDIKKTCHG